MKYLSFIIPCYNSSAYMRKCIDSILPLGDDIEILIIDDGSNKDNTFEIAKAYQSMYPNICKAIHKTNGGHGDALNVGIKCASGIFVRVVDSDDWISTRDGKKLLETIKNCERKNASVDLFVTNYIYDKEGARHKKKVSFGLALPKNKAITWDNVHVFLPGTYLLMHALTYRTKVLRNSGLVLPKKTFYVDNIYAYLPLPYVRKLYYLDVNLYHYYIGRSDQSVNEKVMLTRIAQQYKVTKIMLYDVNLKRVKSDKLRHYMLSYMSIIMTITNVISILTNDIYWYEKKDELWYELKQKNKKLYKALRHTLLGLGVNLPGKYGRNIVKALYSLIRKIYGFN